MPTIEKTVTIEAPLAKISNDLEEPSHLPEMWPSLYEVKDAALRRPRVQLVLQLCGLQGRRHDRDVRVRPYQRIMDKAKGDIESVFA